MVEIIREFYCPKYRTYVEIISPDVIVETIWRTVQFVNDGENDEKQSIQKGLTKEKGEKKSKETDTAPPTVFC